MRDLLHCLRPLVETGNWDYLVVWKLGDNPSRFVQWVGCCCSGAHGVCDKKAKVENKHNTKIIGSLCRDTFIQHYTNSNACSELSNFPHSIPLYSGIHGETVVSTETRWLSNCTEDLSSNLCHESTGTRVLIPVVGGLVELFTTRNVAKDERVIEFVTSSMHKIKMENDAIAAQIYPVTNLNVHPLGSFSHQYPHSGTSLLHRLNINHDPKTSIIPSLEGSSTGSNPTRENLSLNSYSGHVSPNGSVNELIEKRQIFTTPNRDTNISLDNMLVSAVECVNHNVLIEKENVNSAPEEERERYQSKNLITERRRRNRIKDGLLTLRSLVPKISKMDKASILVDAIAYIEELHREKKQLEDELKETAEEGKKKDTDHMKFAKSNLNVGGNPKKRNRNQSIAHETKQNPVQVEVNQIGKRDFLVKLVGDYKQGRFMKLMEGMDSLDLQVIDVNTTTFDGQMMNIFKVEVNEKGVQPKTLKELLIKLTSNLYCLAGKERERNGNLEQKSSSNP